jgi:DNA polymerase-3 subunit gamma/tau
MSYQVIARKYRPQKFADVVGQEHVTQTLTHAIEQNRIAHAYLFCGPRGTGKTTVARIFAKALNCTGGPKADFDVNDPKCQEIADGRSMDVLEIDGASNNGVEQVRELRETCKYAPASSKFKIYIIDEVHMLSTAAFNALLKTLEEPPEHVKFMFATTDPEKVLPTILSRCQRFDLRRIPAKLIVEQLSKIAKEEKVQITPEALFAIARGADGGMRDAESTLDQLISFCGGKIEEPDVLSMFGLTAQKQLLELTGAILKGEIADTLRLLNDLAKNGKDLGRLLSDLLNHFRNLLIFQVSRGDLNLLEVSEAETASLREQSALATADGLTRIMEVFTDAEIRLRDAASKKILLEVSLLKAIEARNAVSLDSVLKRLQDLRSGETNAGAMSAERRPPARREPEVVQNHAVPEASVPTLTIKTAAPMALAETPQATAAPADSDLETLWARLIESVGRASPFTRSYLLEAHPVSFVKNLFTIGFDPEFADHIALVDNSRNHTLLQTKLAELGHPNAQFKFIKAEAPANRSLPIVEPTPPLVAAQVPTSKAVAAQPQISKIATASAAPQNKPASVAFNKDDFKNDPLIQKALEIFKGQIVEVRS